MEAEAKASPGHAFFIQPSSGFPGVVHVTYKLASIT